MPPFGTFVGLRGARGLAAQVVAVHRHVERADGDAAGLETLEDRGDAVGEHHPARGDAEEDEIGAAAIGLEDLVRDAGQSPRDISLLQHGARQHLTSFPASLDGLKGGRFRIRLAASRAEHERRPAAGARQLDGVIVVDCFGVCPHEVVADALPRAEIAGHDGRVRQKGDADA